MFISQYFLDYFFFSVAFMFVLVYFVNLQKSALSFAINISQTFYFSKSVVEQAFAGWFPTQVQ